MFRVDMGKGWGTWNTNMILVCTFRVLSVGLLVWTKVVGDGYLYLKSWVGFAWVFDKRILLDICKI